MQRKNAVSNGSGYPIPPSGTDGYGRPYWIDQQGQMSYEPPQAGLGLGGAIQKGAAWAKWLMWAWLFLEEIAIQWGTLPKVLPTDKEEIKQQLSSYLIPPQGTTVSKKFLQNLRTAKKVSRRKGQEDLLVQHLDEMFDEIIIRQDKRLRGKTEEELIKMLHDGIKMRDPNKKTTIITSLG